MILHFGYIEGISRIDTPYFANIAEQENYFDSHEVVSIDSSFYPPHYLNEIKVDTDDVDFSTTVNYVWFEFNNKTYYYFIDDIEYISETVLKMLITMDTIQTYMFNIKVQNGVIERKFINRWNGNKINRNYIREDISKDEFKLTHFEVINDDTNKWYIVSKNTERFTNKTVTSQVTYYIGTNIVGKTKEMPSSVTYGISFLKPRVNGETVIVKNFGHPDSSQQPGNVSIDQRAFNLAINKPWCVDMYICPFPVFPDINIEEDGKYYINTTNYLIEGLDSGDYGWQASWILSNITNTYPGSSDNRQTLISSYNVKWLNSSFTFNYEKNNKIGVIFNSKYLPVMIDNNYLHFVFGSYFANTTYPLHLLEELNLYCWYTFSIDTGSRYYLINNSSSNVDDLYRVGVIDNNILGLELKNSAWESYVSQNRSRWVGAIGNTAMDLFTKGSTSYLNNARSKDKVDELLGYKGNYTPKKGLLKKKVQREVNNIKRNQFYDNQESKLSMLSNGSRGVIGQLITDFNEQCKPTTMRSSGNFDALINNGALIFKSLEKVIDYEQCAQYFHRNGYLVDEYVNNINNIFEYVNTRWFFNVLKMSDVDLHLINVIEDESTIESITERLFNGLRLWNVTLTHSNWELDLVLTSMTPTSPLPEEGDNITIEFACLGDPVVNGVIDRVQYNPNVTVPASITLKCNKVDIYRPDNLSYLIFNGNRYNIDYDINNVRWTESRITVELGDFTYDNVEKDYLQ